MRLGKLAWGLGLWLVLLACESEEAHPAAPPSGSHGKTPDMAKPNPDSDATTEPIDAGAKEDAASIDPGDGGIVPLAQECKNVPVVSVVETDTPDAILVNAITAPTGFKVSRVLSSWEPSCVTPTIQIAMSDGSCPSGNGHELRFLISALDIASGTVKQGLNSLVAEPDSQGIRVRYVRSDDVEPEGVWGSCTGAMGMISFMNVLDVNDLDLRVLLGGLDTISASDWVMMERYAFACPMTDGPAVFQAQALYSTVQDTIIDDTPACEEPGQQQIILSNLPFDVSVSLEVSPNPTGDGWWIVHPDIPRMKYRLYSGDGRILDSKDMQGLRTWIAADDLHSGMYFIAFYSDGRFISAQSVIVLK